jgi:hypothetical protein
MVSRSRIVATPRCRAERNYSSGNVIRNPSLAGTVVSWLARRWNNELSD